jgi:hypothetical protein
LHKQPDELFINFPEMEFTSFFIPAVMKTAILGQVLQRRG